MSGTISRSTCTGVPSSPFAQTVSVPPSQRYVPAPVNANLTSVFQTPQNSNAKLMNAQESLQDQRAMVGTKQLVPLIVAAL